jgi:hypothetical protein
VASTKVNSGTGRRMLYQLPDFCVGGARNPNRLKKGNRLMVSTYSGTGRRELSATTRMCMNVGTTVGLVRTWHSVLVNLESSMSRARRSSLHTISRIPVPRTSMTTRALPVARSADIHRERSRRRTRQVRSAKHRGSRPRLKLMRRGWKVMSRGWKARMTSENWSSKAYSLAGKEKQSIVVYRINDVGSVVSVLYM